MAEQSHGGLNDALSWLALTEGLVQLDAPRSFADNMGNLINGVAPTRPLPTPFPVSPNDFAAAMAEMDQVRREDPWLVQALRSDHAGELAAVYIYRGARDAARLRPLPEGVHHFVNQHLETERGHLHYFETLLERRERSWLSPVWLVAGYALGFLPTLAGPHALYTTIHAVETYVEEHYNHHITPLLARGPKNAYPKLTAALQEFCSDEVEHAVDAGDRYGFRQLEDDLQGITLARAWSFIVRHGSATAVAIAKQI
ncbi:uncharacterized protein MONBRDRAFT_11685 [Monosiga brevicollis MX1]|uniref:Ubiquinone biosynthesis monooxygenase COQ7 n=1 Tax=Monosiga brevicollis TaxID=81824 RepID=A9V9Z6_MONBE|nr:uncharacterized protein MONBRDRAFT_11685 [Monosiga brevicollis MX1]EDQ85575.1 predicted protein [Monosiga brevicollis MX1]|eukprot:XP_001749524.1 hypothetical protein [Monosiga brevicollis MX1]